MLRSGAISSQASLSDQMIEGSYLLIGELLYLCVVQLILPFLLETSFVTKPLQRRNFIERESKLTDGSN